MKKTISLILCIAMILSSVAFCLPAIAADIDFSVETSEDFAILPEQEAELAASANLPILVDFEDGETAFTPGTDKVTLAVVDGAESKELAVTIATKTVATAHTANYAVDGSLPAGRYKVSFDIRLPSEGKEMSVYFQPEGATREEIIKETVSGTEANLSGTFDVDAETDNVSLLISMRRRSTDPEETYYIDNFLVESVPVTGTIVFDANGGEGSQEAIETQTGYTETLPAETTFTREYYDFAGWSRNKDAAPDGDELVAEYVVEKSDFNAEDEVVFYAIWVRRTYSVALDFDGGVSEAAPSYKANEGENCTVVLPKASEVERTGYLLTGWKDEAGNEHKPGETVVVSEADTFTAQWLDVSGFESVIPVKATGYDGKTTDVDLRYPGAYYVFDTAIDESSLSLEAIGVDIVASYEYIAEENTLVLYPSARYVKAGATLTIPTTQTTVFTADGTGMIKITALTYTFATDYVNPYENMFPYGDAEGAYFPYYTGDANATAVLEEDADGNRYAALRANKQYSGHTHTGIYTNLVDGATYKFTGRYKSLGGYNGLSDGGSIMFNVNFDGKISSTGTIVDGEPGGAITDHANGFNHPGELGTATEWTDVEAEFTVNKTGTATTNMITFYSNPKDNVVTEYAMDDFALYRRIDVSYAPGVYCELPEGAEAPATTGAYLDGTSTEVVVADMPYVLTDDRWEIVADKPWMGSNGVAYAPDDIIDVAVTGPITLTPNIITDKEVFTVKFVGEGLNKLPETISVISGDVIDLSDYEYVISTISGKRFNGWSTTGDFFDIIHGPVTITENTTFIADVSYNIDFAIPANYEGWSVNNATIEKLYNGNSMLIKHKTGSADDVFPSKSGFSVPMAKYKNITLYIDAEYADNGESNKFVDGFETEGIYFGRPGEGADWRRLVPGRVEGFTEDGKYAIVRHKMSEHAQWVGTLNYFRFDAYNGFCGYAIRAIVFEEADPFEEDTIAISGIEIPEPGKLPVTTAADDTGIADVASVTWTPDNFHKGRFAENTAYTVSIAVTPKTQTGKCFADDIKATLNGEAADITLNEDGSAVITYTFPATGEYVNFDYEIVGPDFIYIDGETKQYSVNFTVDEGLLDKTFEWTVDDTTVATIDAATGVLTPLKSGHITVSAQSNYNIDEIRTFEVDIDYYDMTLAISGPDEIAKAGRTTQYTVVVTSENNIYDKSVVWSVDNPSVATINETTGKVVPISDGTIVITATSNYNPGIKAEKTVLITEQNLPGTITYLPGTADAVTNMPAVQEGSGYTALSAQVPVRSGYSFVGWALSDETLDTVTGVTVSSDSNINVYAVWEKVAFSWEFNSQAEVDAFGGSGGQNTRYEDGYMVFETAASGDPMTHKYGLSGIDASLGSIIKIGVKSTVTSNVEVFILRNKDYVDKDIPWTPVNLLQSYARSGQYKASDSTYEVVIDMASNDNPGWVGAITGLRFDFVYNNTASTTAIDYIRFMASNKTLSFDANTTDPVTGMPENGVVVSQGTSYTIPGTPEREGYSFVGWSKYPDDRTTVKKTFTIVDDTTFYAVWDKTVDVDPVETEDEVLNTIGTIEAGTEAILVKTDDEKGTTLTLEYTVGEEAKSIEADVNAIGYAIFDLTAETTALENAVLVAKKGTTFISIVLTDLKTAEMTANTLPGDGNTTIIGGSGSGSSTGGYDYDNTVTDVENDGEQFEVGSGLVGGGDSGTASGSVYKDCQTDDTILFNFDNEYEQKLFGDLRQITLNSMADSVISFTSNGFASGSKDSPALFTPALDINADTHKYIVIKAKQTGLSNPGLQIYFKEKGASYSEAKSKSMNMTEEYSMLVYDMSSIAEWTGIIEGFFFSMKGDVKGTFDIDWIMFTDEVPASMDEIAGAKEIFPVVNTGALPFTDVPQSEWYYNEIAQAYKLGFVKGTSDTTYTPDGSVTIAETITFAVRLNYIYNGKEVPAPADGAEWYTPYVDAAVRAGIIKNNEYTDYNAPALRKQVAKIMAKALPTSYVQAINMFTEIPDLDKKDSAYGSVLRLYNAGILIGSDDQYNFLPETNITRADVAAIINRLAIPANRKRVITEAEIEANKIKYYADDIAKLATLGNCVKEKMTVKDGIAYATGKQLDGRNPDPILYLTSLVGTLDGKNISKITIGLKYNESEVKAGPQIYFTTPAGGWAAERMISGTIGAKADNGVYEVTFDVTKNGQFADTITGLRFDPFNAAFEFGIEYVIIE